MIRKHIAILLGVLGVVMMLSRSAPAIMVQPLSTPELTQDAQIIFVGTCLSRTIIPDRLPKTQYEFSITTLLKDDRPKVTPEQEVLKAGASFGFRQWGDEKAPVSQRMSRLDHKPEVSKYEPGKTYLLFLSAENAMGLRYAVGVGQGAFTISQDANGNQVVKNSYNNIGLTPTSGAAGKGKSVGPLVPAGPLRLDDMISTVRKATGVAP